MSHIQQCLLLDLPPELRILIYEQILIIPGDICVTSLGYPFWTAPPLLQTCQQIRGEASPLYFATNIFQICTAFTGPSDPSGVQIIISWLEIISERHREKLRRLRIDWSRNYLHSEGPTLVYNPSSPGAAEAKAVLTLAYEKRLEQASVSLRNGVLYI